VQKNCNKKLTALEAKKQKNTSNTTTNISKLLYVATLVSKVGDNSWLIDRSATKHMTFDPKYFVTYTKCLEKQFVYLGDNYAMK
jgi:hypothetical protein